MRGQPERAKLVERKVSVAMTQYAQVPWQSELDCGVYTTYASILMRRAALTLFAQQHQPPRVGSFSLRQCMGSSRSSGNVELIYFEFLAAVHSNRECMTGATAPS